MSDISGRILNLAKSYVDVARNRIQDIDAAAIAELQSALSGTDLSRVNPNVEYQPVSNDPMARAASKIAAAQALAKLDEAASSPASTVPSPLNQAANVEDQIAALERKAAPPPAPTTPERTAYRIIGVPDGSERAVVEDAVRKLRERCAPERFAAGSPERQEALNILTRIDEAFTLLMRSFNVETSRFDKLEL